MKKIAVLLKNDLKNIVREWMLIYIAVVPGVLALASRRLIPLLSDYLADEFGFELVSYYPWITGYFVLFVPLLMGMVAGFLLLDEKDDGVVTALIVTPLSKQGYLLYRLVFPLAVGFIYSLLVVPIVGLVKVSLLRVVPVAFVSALEAPLVALFLADFAGNKVEGLALSKGIGLLMLAPLADFILGRWGIAAGIIPTYWPVQGFVLAVQGDFGYWFYILAGLVLCLLLFKILLAKFKRRVE